MLWIPIVGGAIFGLIVANSGHAMLGLGVGAALGVVFSKLRTLEEQVRTLRQHEPATDRTEAEPSRAASTPPVTIGTQQRRIQSPAPTESHPPTLGKTETPAQDPPTATPAPRPDQECCFRVAARAGPRAISPHKIVNMVTKQFGHNFPHLYLQPRKRGPSVFPIRMP